MLGSRACANSSVSRALNVAAQQIREALVVEEFSGRTEKLDRLGVGAFGEIEAAQPVVGGGEPYPGLGILRMQFDGFAEMAFCQPIAALAEIFLSDAQIIVGIATDQIRLVGRLTEKRRTEPVGSASTTLASGLSIDLNGLGS